MSNRDLFGEGTYTGDGNYDLDRLRIGLCPKSRTTTLLRGHDLMEGIFGGAPHWRRDIELFEEFPHPPLPVFRVRGSIDGHAGRLALLPWLFGKKGWWPQVDKRRGNHYP